jgi:hypothetical protein
MCGGARVPLLRSRDEQTQEAQKSEISRENKEENKRENKEEKKEGEEVTAYLFSDTLSFCPG